VVVEAREMVRRFECVVARCSVLRVLYYLSFVLFVVLFYCRYFRSHNAVNHLTGRLLKISSTHLFPFSVLKLPSQLE